jgi:hypothetical protein
MTRTTAVTPEERLNNAILSFAHAVNNDLDEVLRALNKDGQTELADDLLKLRGEWIDASQAALESIGRQPATYKLDDFTFEHLTAWCDRETHTADEADQLRDRIIAYLESLPLEDAQYSVSHGWPHVRNLVDA